MTTTYRVLLAIFALVFFAISAAASPIDTIEARNGTTIEKRAFSSARLTYFVEKGYGACGKKNKDGDHVVALNKQQWDGGKHCGKKINLSYKNKHMLVTVADLCPGCPYKGLDLTKGVFKGMAGSLGPGVLKGTWSWA